MEVHFAKNNTGWKTKVEVDGGRAEISGERDTHPAEVEFGSAARCLPAGCWGTYYGGNYYTEAVSKWAF